ncbi:MAG: lipid II flippase MurJ, partial [Chloroflexota bacterium]
MSQSRALSNAQLIRAALLVIFGFLASGVLGFIRTGILAVQFGTSEALDAFFAAQQIPEMIFVLVAGGALGSSFIPIYAQRREEDEAEAWRLASAVMTLAASAAGILGILVAIFANPIVQFILLPQSPLDVQLLTANMMRLMMITPFIFAISGLIMGILQSHGLFLLPSVAVSMNSIGIMVGALVIAPLIASEPFLAVDAIASSTA